MEEWNIPSVREHYKSLQARTRARHEDVWRSEAIEPLIHNLGTSWRAMSLNNIPASIYVPCF